MKKFIIRFIDSVSGRPVEKQIEAESEFEARKSAVGTFLKVLSIVCL